MSGYYDILGIPTNADESQIKTAYHQLALKWHPDRNLNSDESNINFSKIGEAYNILSDPEKRSAYDRFGDTGLEIKETTIDPRETFRNFIVSRQFVQDDSIQHIDTSIDKDIIMDLEGDTVQDPPLEYTCSCTLEELYTGTVKKKQFSKRVFTSESPEPIIEKKLVKMDIKPGWRSGTRITFAQEGDVHPGHYPGDVVFVIKEKPHPIFKRERDDIYCSVTLTLEEALCVPYKFEVTDLAGEVIEVVIEKVISPKYVHVIEGRGMPVYRGDVEFGDMFVRFDIQFPYSLNDEKKAIVRDLLSDVDKWK
eukprot:TRINITY_DN1294_c0_g1_i1.p1 TRINITY_DN1294_c0_g1~~TRINITY_DN1294_c0_g1_i1.p1  ORF type:complete len:308 (+),score=60.11 TRINITY_DN1294_c0_g1_i1:312-1235(+)